MNPIEWLIYAAALERWRNIGGFLRTQDYHDIRLVVLYGDAQSGHRVGIGQA